MDESCTPQEYREMKAFALHGHTRPVRKIKFNRDGDMFFTCGDDKYICAWTKELKKVGVIEGPGAVKSLAISYNTEYLVGAFTTEGMAIYDVRTGERLQKFDYEERVVNVDFNYGDTEVVVVLKGNGVDTVKVLDF